MIPTIRPAHAYFSHSMNPWSTIPVIGPKKYFDEFMRGYTTNADDKNRLYRHVPTPKHLLGMKFGMCIVLEGPDLHDEHYELIRFITDLEGK